jgi:hypothetical protein
MIDGTKAALSVLACGLLIAGCAGAPTTAPNTDTPPAAARMVCAADAQREISLSLGQTLRGPVAPTWADHLYSCRYVYPAGTVALSVKQLSSTDAATTYYVSARDQLASTITGIGQAAYAESDGSLTVRKDAMVLRVDVHELPAEFGQPPLSRPEAARRVAADIMNCWTGG